MSDIHVSDLLPGYALDCLETGDAMHVAQHLTTCAQCREELTSFRAITEHLALAVPEHVPPSRLKARILRAIESEMRSQSPVSPFRQWWQQVLSVFQPIAPVWSVASIVIIIGLGLATTLFWQRVNHLEDFYHTRDFQLVKLECTHLVPEATGQIVISNDGEVGSLAVAHLPVLQAGQVYQVWLTMNGMQMKGGTFTVNAQGYAVLEIRSPQSLLECGFYITIESEQGDGQSTGETVLQMTI